jgi:hypothetical protein
MNSSGTIRLGVVSKEERRDFYWTAGSFDFPRTEDEIVLPRDWVASSPLFQAVDNDLSPEGLASLNERRTEFTEAPSLEKCIAEAIYERVRRQVLPEAPSRLHCLFAALDAIAAIQFADLYLPPPIFNAQGIAEGGAAPVSTADGR